MSRVDWNFKVHINWLQSIIKLRYRFLLYIKTLSTKELFSFFTNNSPYFVVYNAKGYENVFEKDLIFSNELH